MVQVLIERIVIEITIIVSIQILNVENKISFIFELHSPRVFISVKTKNLIEIGLNKQIHTYCSYLNDSKVNKYISAYVCTMALRFLDKHCGAAAGFRSVLDFRLGQNTRLELSGWCTSARGKVMTTFQCYFMIFYTRNSSINHIFLINSFFFTIGCLHLFHNSQVES